MDSVNIKENPSAPITVGENFINQNVWMHPSGAWGYILFWIRRRNRRRGIQEENDSASNVLEQRNTIRYFGEAQIPQCHQEVR